MMAYTKRTKQEVNYGRGHPPDGDYCEICQHYLPISGEAPECALVLGSVKWSDWCRLFRRTNSERQRNNKGLRYG